MYNKYVVLWEVTAHTKSHINLIIIYTVSISINLRYTLTVHFLSFFFLILLDKCQKKTFSC